MKQRVVAILQARMGSSRFPGKVLADLGGLPMLAQIVQRVSSSKEVDLLVIATTELPQDDTVAVLAEELGAACFRGSEQDLLDRYFQAARLFSADVIVRITGDNPFVDGDLVDRAVGAFLTSDPPPDYVSTGMSETYPLGLSVEVFSFRVLETAWREDAGPAHREHVTVFIKRQPNRFRLHALEYSRPCGHMRLTVDEPQDLALAQTVFAHFGHNRFSWEEVIALLTERPEWSAMNRHVEQKTV